MIYESSVVAVFDDHLAADSSIKKLTTAGFNMRQLIVIGKG